MAPSGGLKDAREHGRKDDQEEYEIIEPEHGLPCGNDAVLTFRPLKTDSAFYFGAMCLFIGLFFQRGERFQVNLKPQFLVHGNRFTETGFGDHELPASPLMFQGS